MRPVARYSPKSESEGGEVTQSRASCGKKPNIIAPSMGKLQWDPCHTQNPSCIDP